MGRDKSSRRFTTSCARTTPKATQSWFPMALQSTVVRFLGLLYVLALSSTGGAVAVPSPIHGRDEASFLDPSAVTTLSSSDLSSFLPYEQFARAAYCSLDAITQWTCGGRFNLHTFVSLLTDTLGQRLAPLYRISNQVLRAETAMQSNNVCVFLLQMRGHRY